MVSIEDYKEIKDCIYKEEHAEALENCFREIRLNDANYKRI
jgi:hypothetical protein